MTAPEVEKYLHAHIPISGAMGVRVLALDAEGATLRAPLGPNINHRATVFGGSVSAVAILAGWAWLHTALHSSGQSARLVIQENHVRYLAPIDGDFEARCHAPPAAMFEKFLGTFRRHHKARLTLAVTLACGGVKGAVFTGDYVAIRTV